MIIKDTAKLKTSELMNLLEKEISIYSYWNYEELDKNFPRPKIATEREFSDNDEPDVLGKSWEQFNEEFGDRIMTMREYIIAQTMRAKEKKSMLDEKNWTLFSERLPGGKVACGYWNPYVCYRQVRFDWSWAGDVDRGCGARICINTSPMIKSVHEENKNKQGFRIICEQCGFQKNI